MVPHYMMSEVSKHASYGIHNWPVHFNLIYLNFNCSVCMFYFCELTHLLVFDYDDPFVGRVDDVQQ